MSSLRRSLASTLLVLTVVTLGPACGLITNDATGDTDGGAPGSGAASTGAASTGATSSGGGDIDDGQLPGGTGGLPGSGASLGAGGAPGECFFQHDEVQPCPDYCTALLQARCEEESPYELSSVENCTSGGHATRISWSGETGGLICDYRDGAWVGVHQYSHTAAFCDGTSTDIYAGEALTGCPAPDPQLCAGAGGTGEGGAPPDVPRASCFSSFSGTCGPCCPSPTPDCTGQPDGYPGYSCINGFCSCSCYGGEWSCGC